MKASDLFVRCLEVEKIEHIFGVPGEQNADFMMSLERTDKIRFIVARHEQGATSGLRRESHQVMGGVRMFQPATKWAVQFVRAERLREVAAALEQAFATSGPSLITLPIDYCENTLLPQRLENTVCPI